MPAGRTRRAVPPRMPFEQWRCPLLYLSVRKLSGEASIAAVLRLKVLNLLLALLPVHSAFLGNPKI